MDQQELARLRRRYERERAARREAEAISERVTRDLYDRKAELELLETVATAANQAATIREATQVALERVCEHTGWPVGHVYVYNRETHRLESAGIWHAANGGRYDEFRRVSERMSFEPGVGLPGRVLESREPAWIVNVNRDPNFPRARMAGEIGVSAGFAFPVLFGDTVLAVLEFYSPQATEPDDALLRIMAQVGNQLGRAIERKLADDERAKLTRQTEVLLESAGEGIYGFDAEGITTFVNPAAARMLGYQPEELVGRSVHQVLHRSPGGEGVRHDAGRCPFLSFNGKSSKTGEDVFFRSDGTSFPVEFIRTPIRPNGGPPTGAVLTFNDIADRQRFESQLKFLADHDALTGLYNRRRFEEELERQVSYSQRYGGGAALVLDLDNFKYVNDTLGHQAGDELIRSTATLLRKRLRPTDVIARLGGDEFAVLLPQAGRQQAEKIGRELLEAVRANATAFGDQPIRVTTSVGITVLGQQQVTAEEALVEADIAMYQAKDGGRDAMAVYTPESGRQVQVAAGMAWTQRIREALENGGFVLYCQPIIDLSGDRIPQYELLLRMKGEEDEELILPGAFLPPAERFGLIRDIDRWVVHQAIELLAQLKEQDGRAPELLLEINLSGKSVGDPELPELIEQRVHETGVDPRKLVFEITETAAIANMEDASTFAKRLTRLGCRFALDDFGAGFGSFYYLKYLPLDYLKIDGDFIEDLVHSPLDQRMVKAMVEVARGLEMKTIAEYVGDERSMALLREFGVDYAQGFHLGKPKPVSTLLD
jgi:diguanylate cyclase (GGDEF)-like protein/PAS domain S-box-containing protein